MRSLRIAAVLLALTAAGAAAATPAPSEFFRLSHVQVSSEGGSLAFTVAVNNVQPANRPTLAWSVSPAGGAACENPGFPGGTRSRNGLVVWDQQGASFRWDGARAAGCAGAVSVVAENQYEHCTAIVAVTRKGSTSAAPACALGGYAVGFSTLPVPAGVFLAYDRVKVQLGGPPRGAAAAALQIRAALKAQTAGFDLFPPVWFCNFESTFAPITALQTDLASGASAAAARDARAADHALSSCAPTSVRSAFDRIAASAQPQSPVLAATLEHYFPAVFGFRYLDLVDRFAAENAALAAVEAAVSAGKPGAAAGQVAAVARSAGAISAGLGHYEEGVVRVESAHG